MLVGVPSEESPQEWRVALVPAVVPALAKVGLQVLLERGAGEKAGYPDELYKKQGASVTADRLQLLADADIILPISGLKTALQKNGFNNPGKILVGLLNPFAAPEAVRALAERRVTAFALEFLPRISRAQSMDALTSMATIAGYKAVLLAAGILKKMFPMMFTAAGTITPAKILIVGAGVAGLQAVATARRLGAVVQAYDVRPAVKEQIESLGAKFVELGIETKEAEGSGGYAKSMGEEFYRRQREMLARVIAESDVVITTASIPGKKAPVLITRDMVAGMQPGSVIMDLAAETGGNCELTRPGETFEQDGVVIAGPLNLPATVPYQASQLYAKNVVTFLQNMVKDGRLTIDREDEIIRDTLLTEGGEIVNDRIRALLGMPLLSGAQG